MNNKKNYIRELKELARNIKLGSVDKITGIRELLSLYIDSSIEDEDIYRGLSLVNSDTDFIIKGPIQSNFSSDFLEKQKEFEKAYLRDMRQTIDRTLEKISNITI